MGLIQKLWNSMRCMYLAISALLRASSASWFSSLKVVLFSKMDASGGWSPCRVLWACAHLRSLSSVPKFFLLVNAIWMCMPAKTDDYTFGRQQQAQMSTHLTVRKLNNGSQQSFSLCVFLPSAQGRDSKLSRSARNGWGTWWHPAGCRWRCCRARWHRPSPIQCPWSQQTPSWHIQRSE